MPAPIAFNQAGEKLQATRGELPRVSHEVAPDAGTGLLSNPGPLNNPHSVEWEIELYASGWFCPLSVG